MPATIRTLSISSGSTDDGTGRFVSWISDTDLCIPSLSSTLASKRRTIQIPVDDPELKVILDSYDDLLRSKKGDARSQVSKTAFSQSESINEQVTHASQPTAPKEELVLFPWGCRQAVLLAPTLFFEGVLHDLKLWITFAKNEHNTLTISVINTPQWVKFCC